MSTITVPDLMTRSHGGTVTWSDFFCGGGGSSNGLHHVPGFEVRYALNHWDLAVMAHAANFPKTDHEVTMIEDVHPRRFGRTDCAWFSPSCTAQAYCGPRGIDDESVRSRATMWDVCRWTDYHLYDVVVVENVIEAKLWCDEPSHRRIIDGGRVKGCSCGSSYEAWIRKMKSMGYRAREVYFNSQHALVPQSRDRMYVVFVREGIEMPDLDFTPPCWCEEHQAVVAGVQTWKKPSKGSARDNSRLHQWGRYGTQFLYHCPECQSITSPAVIGSWSIIDTTIPIDTIGSRKKPIATATRRRIKIGLERIGQLQPIQVAVGGNLFERPGYARVWSLGDPLRTITASSYMAMCMPVGAGDAHAKSGLEPSHAITGSDRLGMVVIPNRNNALGRTAEEPMGTITTAPANHMLLALRDGMSGFHPAVPMAAQATRADQAIVATPDAHRGVLVYNGVPGFVRALDDAAGTITSRDKQSYLIPYNRTGMPISISNPSPTVTASDRNALLEVSDEDIDHMLFRMLKWPELQRGQAMHVRADGQPYELTARVRTDKGTYKDLNDTQRVKMIGNAVSSPVAAMIGHAVAEVLAA